MGASVLVALLAACGPPSGVKTGAPAKVAAPPVLAPRPLDQVFVLEAGGSAPEDTVVTISPGAGRVVVLRRSAPDFGLFATLTWPARPAPAAAAAATVTLKPIPGRYGLDLAITGALSDSASITFSYGAHFVAPAGARERYGSNIAFERELAIGRVDPSGQVIFLPTTRPGSDMLTAPLAGPGRYLVAAPR